jgi:Helix-turn-helix domain of resolvase
LEGITAEGTPSKVRKQKSMAEIRRLVAKGYSHNDIMKQLKLAPRTYFRYLSEAFENDWLLLKQENNDTAMLALEISKLKEIFREAERMLLQIINSPKTRARQKIAACDALCRTAAADLQLTYQGPLIMNRAIKDIDLAWHFKGRFTSGEAIDFV